MSITLKANGSIVFGPAFENSNIEAKPRYFLGDDVSPYRNRVTNGNMIIAQRTGTTTFTHPGLANDSNYRYYAADRFRIFAKTNGAGVSNPITYVRTVNTSAAETPDGHDSYVRITFNNTVSTVAASDYVVLETGIEGCDIMDLHWGSSYGVPACLSFWARVSSNGVGGNGFSVAIRNASTSTRCYVAPFYFPPGTAATWVKFYIPIPPCGDGTWNIEPGALGLIIDWTIFTGTTYKPTTQYEDNRWTANNFLGYSLSTTNLKTAGDTFDITGVTFEKAPAMNYSAHVLASSHLPSAIGNLATLWYSGDADDTTITVNLPFSVTYYGRSSSTLYFGTNGYLSFLEPSSSSVLGIGVGPAGSSNSPSLGFFRTVGTGGGGGSATDKRLKTLYGGSTTVTMEDGASESIYHLRAVMYNYTGNSAVETIIEFRIYQNFTYEGYNVIDVHYIQNNNGDIVLEAIPGNLGIQNSQELYAYQILQTNSSAKMFRVLTKAKADVATTGSLNPYWASGNYSFNKYNTVHVTGITEDIQYRLGVSDEAGANDMGYETIRCLRYYEKLWGVSEDTINSSPSGNISTGGGIYPYYRAKAPGTSADYQYIPFYYHDKCFNPSFTTYDTNTGARGYLSIDGYGGYPSTVTWSSTNGAMMYWNSATTMYGITAYTEVQAELI